MGERRILKSWEWEGLVFSLREDYQHPNRFGVFEFEVRSVDGGFLPTAIKRSFLSTIVHMGRGVDEITLDDVLGRFAFRYRRNRLTGRNIHPSQEYMMQLHRQRRLGSLVDQITD